ncbi:AraC family transcriptional regulator [Polaribacter sp. SA4-12]|uniref:AraC family transcriptional regulator n=1 Tax=Polaribacter sp. SA4-12 TaxID=1312072 RepID=UPI000B3C9D4C|nr:AraC family transcriptional regulator [Polaribacter sp. SA4-12]ARV16529.1 AraC family transcriptional regulator [Polaribacter sp. SA4-12]
MKAQFEKISYKQSSLHAFTYKNTDFDAPFHFHPEYELTYIIKGKGIRYVGNNIQKFEEGDFVLLGPNLPHCWKNTHEFKGTVKSIVLQWNDDLLGKDWFEKDEFNNIKLLLKKASKGILFNKKYSKKIERKLTKIINKPPLEKLLCFLLLLEELYTLDDIEILTSVGFSANLNLKANYRIDTVFDYVKDNYNKKIKLEEASSLVSMSNEAFCRFFKKSLNKSFFTFINEYKINLASKMLIETNKQVSQIAYDCGYESLPFFYRQFQKFMNCSPLAFRKTYLKADL